MLSSDTDKQYPRRHINPTDTPTPLFRHNLWANACIIDLLRVGLSHEQLDATLVGTFGSIRDGGQSDRERLLRAAAQ